jgi:hypothetical protein
MSMVNIIMGDVLNMALKLRETVLLRFEITWSLLSRTMLMLVALF